MAAMHLLNRRLILLVVVLITVSTLLHPCFGADQNGTVYLHATHGEPSTTLFDAFADPAAVRIIMLSDYVLKHTYDMHSKPPVVVNRSLTVEGYQGQDVLLDLSFADGLVELCPNCTVTFRKLTLKNDRRGSGSTVDLFHGKPGSQVVLQDVIRLKLGCIPGPDAIKALAIMPRCAGPQGQLRSQRGPQLMRLENTTYRGKLYPDARFYEDVSMDIPAALIEGQGFMGGYCLEWNFCRCRCCWCHCCLNQSIYDVAMICFNTVDPACLQAKGTDECIDDLIDAVVHPVQQQQQRKASATVAAIAVPASVAFILAIAVTLLWLRGHRRKQLLQMLARDHKAAAGGTPGGTSAAASIESGRTGRSRQSAPPVERATSQDWQVVTWLTSPLLGPVQDKTIHFGHQLGKGSFGCVYKARFANRDVAVKVIEHSPAAIQAVEEELALMFSFNHPNIVRGLHYVTYFNSSEESDYCSSRGAPLGSASNQGSSQHRHHQQQQDSSNNSSGASPHMHVAVVPAAAISPKAAAADSAAGNDSIPLSSSNNNRSQGQQQQGSSGSASSAPSCIPAPTAVHSRAASRAETHLVLELCDCTLSQYMAGMDAVSRSEASLERLLQMLQDIAQGLAVLHAANIVHADLNGRNVLVSSQPSMPGGAVAKVADLGLARLIDEQRTHRTTNTLGTMSHVAPEVLRSGKMSTAADLYSFGILMWELYTGQPAFRKLQYWQFFETVALHGLRPLIPLGMPADFQLLMEHCWQTDPASRPNAHRVLECLRFMIEERKSVSSAASTAALRLQQRSSSVPADILLAKLPPASQQHQQHQWGEQQQQQQQELGDAAVLQPPAAKDATSSYPSHAGVNTWFAVASYDFQPHAMQQSNKDECSRPFDPASSTSSARLFFKSLQQHHDQQQLAAGQPQKDGVLALSRHQATQLPHDLALPPGAHVATALAGSGTSAEQQRVSSVAGGASTSTSTRMSSSRASSVSWLRSLQESSLTRLREHSSRFSMRESSGNKLWDHTWFV